MFEVGIAVQAHENGWSDVLATNAFWILFFPFFLSLRNNHILGLKEI